MNAVTLSSSEAPAVLPLLPWLSSPAPSTSLPASPTSSSTSSSAWDGGAGINSSSPAVDQFLCGLSGIVQEDEAAVGGGCLAPATASTASPVGRTPPPPKQRLIVGPPGSHQARKLFPREMTSIAGVGLRREGADLPSASSRGAAGPEQDQPDIDVKPLPKRCLFNIAVGGGGTLSSSFYVAADVDVDEEVWRFWQPFQGGRVFVATQVTMGGR